MSRLDSVIRRLTAQRECINYAANLIHDIPGPVLEIGLGNGRTFDHLRECLPDREIFAFDRAIGAHPTCIPDAHNMIVGEIRETLPFCGPRIGEKAALAHVDLGQGDPTMTLSIDAWLSPMIVKLMTHNGIILSNQALTLEGYKELPVPEGTPAGRYWLYQNVPARRKPGSRP